MSEASALPEIDTRLATILVVLAAIGFGTVPFFAKELNAAGLPAHVIALSRYALTALVLLPFLRFRNGLWRATLWGFATGVALGLGWISYVEALDHVPVSTAGVLYMTYPIFTLAIAWVFFREAPGRRALIAALIILAAAMLAMSPSAVSPEQVPALLLSLTAPLAFGAGINILTRLLIALKPLSRMASVTLGSVIGLAPLMVGSDIQAVAQLVISNAWLIAGLALATALIPQLIYTINAPIIGSARTAIAGSIELPTMFVVGWLAFAEPAGIVQLIAGAMVIASIAITPPRAARGVTGTISARRN
ncbi:MAG: EamA family transporter [Rhizobiaceae bacterium]|nr:EamA family transporter [Rhizobiaceae bacterium]